MSAVQSSNSVKPLEEMEVDNDIVESFQNTTESESGFTVEDIIQETTTSGKKGLKKSHVYKFFNQDPKSFKWICNVKTCRTQFVNPKSGGTGSLVNHLKHVHKKLYAQFQQLSSTSKQGKMTSYVKVEHSTAGKPAFDTNEFKDKLVKFIITTNQPFSLVEEDAFQDMVVYAASDESDVSLPSRKPMRNLIQQQYQKMFEDLKQTLTSNTSKISFSIDGWTSRNGYAFQGVVGHWIDEDWNLRTTVLDLSILEGSHSGANLADNFGKVLTRYGVWEKLLALTADNASNMNTCSDKLEQIASENGGNFNAKDYRIRCMAHIINLSCQEIIKIISASPNEDLTVMMDDDEGDSDNEEDDETETANPVIHFVEKIRRASAAIRSSPQRREQLAKQCEAAGMVPINAILDVRTRWNSTLEMLERAMKLKKPLVLTLQSFKRLKHLIPTTSDWTMIEKTIHLLQPFKEATKLLSEEGIPKLSQTLAIYNALFEHLERYMDPVTTNYRDKRDVLNTTKVDQRLSEGAKQGWEKFTEYYPTTDGLVYSAATVLDPRFKLQWYSVTGWRKEWITEVRASVRRIWKAKYKITSTDELGGTKSSESSSNSSSLKSLILQKFQAQNEDSPTDELSRYLSEQTETVEAITKLSEEHGGKDGVLCWWKNNRNSYPQLSKMARDFLAASGTGVPVERLFSTATDVLSHRRQSMSPETIQQCLCLKNWYKNCPQSVIADAVREKALGESV